MSLKNSFETRFEDVEVQYEHLRFIDGIEAYKHLHMLSPTSNDSTVITTELQKCLKSQLIITLYNVVEFTAYECAQTICDTINDESIPYPKLSNNVFELWHKMQYTNKLGIEKIRKISKQHILHPLDKVVLALPDNLFSGNVDYRKVKEVFMSFGCNTNFNFTTNTVPQSLLKIKNARNKLAHGENSFSSLGSLYILREIKTFKDDVFECMELLIKEVESYLTNKKYIKT